jgi:membrane-bound lytic murein transglycosylase C
MNTSRRFGMILLVLLVAGSGTMLAACSKSLSSNVNTVLDVARVATSSNPAKAIERTARSMGKSYERNPARALRDLRVMRARFNKLVALLSGRAGKQWGKHNARIPDRAHYVKYTHNYKSRAVVDFDRGRVRVETLVEANALQSLKSALITTLLTPDDPRAVDLFTDAEIKLTSRSRPYLYGLLLDRAGKPIGDPKAAGRFADWQLDQARKTRTIHTESGKKTVHYVDMAMVSNVQDKQAQKYQPAVSRFAKKYGISESLVFGVIRTESNFNPFAVSSAPAFGLMQLVPGSGGREGYKKARGRDRAPSRDFLFNANNNIELGTAYLGVLFDEQLKGVYDKTSREYCVISAYNTGPSNVLRAFSRNKATALDMINRRRPPQVYDHLMNHLPYKETRRYIQKVVKYRRDYVRL